MIAGGDVADRSGRRRGDIVVLEDRIESVELLTESEVAALRDGGAQVLDAAGCVVTSGLVDLFARLGEPGNEEAETVASASAAAALGGFTAVLAQPDTEPMLDRLGELAELRRSAAATPCHIVPAATITAERAGTRLSPMAELADAGVRWFTDVGPLADAGLLRRALQYAGPLAATVSVRPSTSHLGGSAAMAEGAVSARMGVAGEPAASEELAAAAAIGVARLTGGRLHLDRISAARTVDLVRAAKADGLSVTASVTAEHLLFTDDDVDGYDPLMRAEPPYRSSADRAALVAGVVDRSIDAVVSGHSPVPPQAKDLPFDEALPGVAAFETCAALVLSHPDIDLDTALDALAWRPAELIAATDLGGGALSPGHSANLVVLDLDCGWTLGERGSASMARNTPHRARQMSVMVRATVVAGRVVVSDGRLCADQTDRNAPIPGGRQ